MTTSQLPIPAHFNPDSVGEVWKVDYQARAADAESWIAQHHIQPASQDSFRICLMPIDVQNTFCIPNFELYVAGRSGTGAVDDNQRLCRFIYQNLNRISQICPTLDTHQATQIFHSIFLINDKREHPPAYSLISIDDIESGEWQLNPEAARSLGIGQRYGEQYLRHYVKQLKAGGKYDLTIWPYHAMLGGIGHALVSALEEAIFFHGMARYSQADFQLKGQNPLTENYSALKPEVLIDANGQTVASKNSSFIKKLLQFDAIIIAGQAKSHCVASTITDLLTEILATDKSLAAKVYLLEDCTSSVVIPGVIDYTDQADTAFQKFAEAGMHLVRSTDAMADWPDYHND